MLAVVKELANRVRKMERVEKKWVSKTIIFLYIFSFRCKGFYSRVLLVSTNLMRWMIANDERCSAE